MTTLLVSALIMFAVFLTLVFVDSMIKQFAKERSPWPLPSSSGRSPGYGCGPKTSKKRAQEYFRRVDAGSPGMIALYIFLGLFLIGIFGGIWHLNSKDKSNPYWNR